VNPGDEASKASISCGAINLGDTASNYRFQKAERSVGRSIKIMISEGRMPRDQVFVSTKNGYLAPDADYPTGYERYIMDELISSRIIKQKDIVDGSHCMTERFL